MILNEKFFFSKRINLIPFCLVFSSCFISLVFSFIHSSLWIFLLSLLLLGNNFIQSKSNLMNIFVIYYIEWSALQDLTFSCVKLICNLSFHNALFLLSMIFQLITSIMWLSINFRNNISVSDTPSSFDHLTILFIYITPLIRGSDFFRCCDGENNHRLSADRKCDTESRDRVEKNKRTSSIRCRSKKVVFSRRHFFW